MDSTKPVGCEHGCANGSPVVLGFVARICFRHNHLFRQLRGLAYVCAMMDDSEATSCLCKQASTMKYEV